jgi:hypothetical protein
MAGIRIAERARITQEFKKALIALSIERLKQIKEEMAYLAGIQLKFYKNDIVPTIVRLGKIAKDPQQCLEELLTRLRGLNYTSYEIITLPGNQDIKFLVGTTKDIEIRYGGTVYKLGPFQVCIPFSYTVGGRNRKRETEETWQFIPLKADERQHGDYRHPHHYGRWGQNASTCWGDFNPLVSDLQRRADIP